MVSSLSGLISRPTPGTVRFDEVLSQVSSVGPSGPRSGRLRRSGRLERVTFYGEASARQPVSAGDLQAEHTIQAQGLRVTWTALASDLAGSQITGSALSNTQAGPDMYVLELSTPAAALDLAGSMQAYAGPFTDAQGNDVGSVSIQPNGFEVIVSTDSTPAMTAFLNALKHQH